MPASNPVKSKVEAAGLAGAFTVLLVLVLSQAGVELPPEAASAITTIVAFAAAYWKGE